MSPAKSFPQFIVYTQIGVHFQECLITIESNQFQRPTFLKLWSSQICSVYFHHIRNMSRFRHLRMDLTDLRQESTISGSSICALRKLYWHIMLCLKSGRGVVKILIAKCGPTVLRISLLCLLQNIIINWTDFIRKSNCVSRCLILFLVHVFTGELSNITYALELSKYLPQIVQNVLTKYSIRMLLNFLLNKYNVGGKDSTADAVGQILTIKLFYVKLQVCFNETVLSLQFFIQFSSFVNLCCLEFLTRLNP